MLDHLGVSINDSRYPANTFHLTSDQVEKIKARDSDIAIELIPGHGGDLFPHDKKINGDWTIDNYGPLTIPKAGHTVDISLKTFPYTRESLTSMRIKNFKLVTEKFT